MSKFQKYFTNLGVDVQKVLELEKFAGCSYVGQLPGGRQYGDEVQFRDAAVDVFYQPNRELGHSNYFSVFLAPNGSVYVANAEYVTQLQLHGVYDSEGDVLYARYQHDFRFTFDEEFGVDGGWWSKDTETGYWGMWGRTLGSRTGFPETCNVMVKAGELVIV